jgi:hypothetical protein
MSTSGTITYNETRDQIIADALSLLGVVAAGETVQANDLTFCAAQLNKMVKAWMAQGIHLWTEEEGTLFLVHGQTSLSLLAGATGAKASDGTGTPVETTLATTAGSGANSIVVTTATGMSVNDNIGIVQNNQVFTWTTISSISGTTIGLNTTLSNTASSGNGVFTYTTQLARPLSIQNARLRDNNGFDRLIEIKPRVDYMNIPQKGITGDPIILFYSPQLLNGLAYLWPTPSDINKRIEITYLRTIQDFDSGSDNPDLPQEWLEAITFNLAVRVAPAYEINLSSGGITGNPDILRQAAQYLDDLKAWDSEQPYIQIITKPRF